MKKNTHRAFRLRDLFSFFLLISFLFVPLSPLIALDAPIQSLDVNGVNIYNVGGGYNESHGITGVSFDVGTHTLTLNNTNLDRISASGDLDINLVGSNSIMVTTDSSAILAMNGDLTITGDSASLNISGFSDNQPAITIGVGGRLTIGATGTSITVSVPRGLLINCEDTYVVEGNTFNPPATEEPLRPPQGDPIQIFVGDTLVIDETSDPQITSASGNGWEIESSFYGGYQFNIDATISPTFPYISGSGDGAISINAIGGDVTIARNIADNMSVNFDGNVDILFGMGEVGNVYLNGGILTHAGVLGGDGDVFIGSLETPSTSGIGASYVSLNFGNISIYTLGTGLYYYNPTPLEGEGMLVQARQGAKLTINTSNTATENVNSAIVIGGGIIDLSYTSQLGTFTPQSGYWEWTKFTGTAEENTEPTVVDCVEGIDSNNFYSLTLSANNFLLESTSKALFQLGFNYDASDDARVVNGTVNVIAAKGYKFVSGDFYDFSIEEGTEVTIELLPDYGYQYVSGGINGNPTSPEEGKASYTFTMPSNHVHISAIFEKTPDIVNIETNKITSASLTMPANQINGNAELIIDEVEDVQQSKFTTALDGFEVGSYLDLSLNEVIKKGGTQDVWRTNITELEEDSTITLTLSDELEGHAQYKILRDHEGTVEEIEAIYNPSTGTLTFNTGAYSTYVLAYNDPVNPPTYDNILNGIALGLSSILGLCGMKIYTKKRRK